MDSILNSPAGKKNGLQPTKFLLLLDSACLSKKQETVGFVWQTYLNIPILWVKARKVGHKQGYEREHSCQRS